MFGVSVINLAKFHKFVFQMSCL